MGVVSDGENRRSGEHDGGVAGKSPRSGSGAGRLCEPQEVRLLHRHNYDSPKSRGDYLLGAERGVDGDAGQIGSGAPVSRLPEKIEVETTGYR